ncbi:hypothetical protein MASR2M39_18110 [Ignavibacteriales bacterium]
MSGSSIKLWTSRKAIVMNKWYILLIFISLISIPSFSQEISPAAIESFTPNTFKFNPVLSAENFRFANKYGTHWKNNNNGEFYLTRDGGRTWTTLLFTSACSFVIPSGGERFYCVAGGRLYKTDTGGMQWGGYDLPDPDVKEMQFVTTFSGVYITNTGVLYQTDNPSEGWSLKLNQLSTSAKLFANANAVYATDSTNSIYFSKDMGKNFRKIPHLFTNSINSARFINGLSYVGSGSSFYIMDTSGIILDSGTVNSPNTVSRFHFLNNGMIYAFRDSSDLLLERLPNGSWERTNFPISLTFFKSYQNSDSLLFLLSNSNPVGTLTFSKWGVTKISVVNKIFPEPRMITAMNFINGSTGYLGTAEGFILKTTNLGNTWVELNTSNPLPPIKFISARDQNNLFVSGADGFLATSTDGGSSWQTKPKFTSEDLLGVSCLYPYLLFAATSTNIFRSTNLGSSWSVEPLGSVSIAKFREAVSPKVYTVMPNSQARHFREYWGQNTLSYHLDVSYSKPYPQYTSGYDWVAGREMVGGFKTDFPLTKIEMNNLNGFAAVGPEGNMVLNLDGSLEFFKLPFTLLNFEFALIGKSKILMANSPNGYTEISFQNSSPVPGIVKITSPSPNVAVGSSSCNIKWEEPYSLSPIEKYHLVVAYNDTSNIVVNDSGLISTSYILSGYPTNTKVFVKIRAKNSIGWGDFSEPFSFSINQSAFEISLRGFTKELLLSILKDPQGVIWSGTNNGKLYFSTDNGNLWDSVLTGFNIPLNNIFFASDNPGLILSENGQYLRSTDHGISWQLLNIAASGSSLKTVLYFSASNIQIIDDAGQVFVSQDGGLSFNLHFSNPFSNKVNYSSCNGAGNAIFCGDNGLIAASSDYGTTWQVFNIYSSEKLVYCKVTSPGNFQALSASGIVFTSTDNGLGWTTSDLKLKMPLSKIIVLEDGRLLSAGIDGNITVIAPDLNTNSSINFFFQNGFRAVGNSDGNSAIAVGYSGLCVFVKAKNSNENDGWHLFENITGNLSLNDVYLFPNKKAIAVGNNGVILLKQSGSNAWSTVYPGVENDLQAVKFLDDNLGLIVGDGGIILKTSDGGFTWSVLNPGFPNLDLKCVHIDNNEKYIAGGTQKSLVRSSDGGLSWEKISFNTTKPVETINNIVPAFDGTLLLNLYTEDLSIPPVSNNIAYYAVYFGSDIIAYPYFSSDSKCKPVMFADKSAFTYRKKYGLLFYPELGQGGYSKTKAPFIEPATMFSRDSSKFIFALEDGTLITTENGWDSWKSINLFNTKINQLSFTDPDYGIAVGDGFIGYFDRTTVDIKNETITNPNGFIVNQNFPNPFNGETVISLNLPEPTLLKITLYDITGAVVKKLENGYVNGGFYQKRFTFNDLSSGVYFYRVEAGKFVSTKKMILLR